MARKKRVFYPPAKTSTRQPAAGAGPEVRNVNDRSVSIDTSALAGRGDFKVGDRVRIGTGLYAGETAIVESVSGGVIPAALVRTEAGHTRRARTIDLERVRPGEAQPAQPSPEPPPAG